MTSQNTDISDLETNTISCPVCNKLFAKNDIEDHVNKCLFLHTSSIDQSNLKDKRTESSNFKRNSVDLNMFSSREKRLKSDANHSFNTQVPKIPESTSDSVRKEPKSIPLAEKMRPQDLEDFVGQTTAFGQGSMLRQLLMQNKVTNMILWGPPGCGKDVYGFHSAPMSMRVIAAHLMTSLANVIANICKEQHNMRFVKLSATMSGINDVKEVVKIAKNEAQFKRQTVLFMDEIHRFNKLQQDTFLPHVENGTIILVGATTENPSFSLNNALLSRCKVVVLEKLSVNDVLFILKRALKQMNRVVVMNQNGEVDNQSDGEIPKCIVEEASLQWLAEVCDGDARIALGALELSLDARASNTEVYKAGPGVLSVEDIKNGIKRSHMLYDRRGEEHYNTISALQKSIRASDDNAALYWTTRALHGGEDPLYIARRLIRTACEDIGLADQNAIVESVACLQGCQHVGMPECDVLLAQCAVKLARAPKSREVYNAMKRCQRTLTLSKGPLPPVPLHLRNAPTKLMKELGYGSGYNLLNKEESGLSYMPEGMEKDNYFSDSE